MLVYYDHLEAIDFGARGRGSADWGWDQNVHFSSRFTYEGGAGKVTLKYLDRPAAGVRRDLTYVIERGAYAFERTTPVGREKTTCERKITFDESPFPPNQAPAKEYFRECTTKRLASER
jgi:hypothetical protein